MRTGKKRHYIFGSLVISDFKVTKELSKVKSFIKAIDQIRGKERSHHFVIPNKAIMT